MALLPAPGKTRLKPPDWRQALAMRSAALNASLGLGGLTSDGRVPGLGGPRRPDDEGDPTFGINPSVLAPATIAGNTVGTSNTTPPPGGGDKGTPFPGSVKIPGYDPDLAALIRGDANVIAGEADLNKYEGDIADARRTAIRRAIIALGLDPGGVGDVDEATRQAALANQFSTQAELKRGRSRGSTDLAARLASRGILDSGGLAGGESRLQENYERSTTQAVQAILDRISGYEQDYSAKQYDIGNRRAALRAQAADRIAKDPRYQPVGETDAQLDAETGAYVTSDGRWYDAQGNRLPGKPAPKASTTAPPPGDTLPPLSLDTTTQQEGMFVTPTPTPTPVPAPEYLTPDDLLLKGFL